MLVRAWVWVQVRVWVRVSLLDVSLLDVSFLVASLATSHDLSLPRARSD